MILLVDNYDSFVYNLARYVRELGHACEVVRNDAITLDEVAAFQPTHVIVSPGPCTPNEAGMSNALIERFGARTPILGVCLGHLCIGQVYGARVVRAARPMHGKASLVRHDGHGVFEGLPNPLRAARYHSLVIDPESLSSELVVAAWGEEGEVMALVHRRHPVVGVQFHPESVLTEAGHPLIENFLASRSGG